MQTVRRYSAADPADIISDLLQNYAGVPGSYVPITAWRPRLRPICSSSTQRTSPSRPSVNKLISELIEQAALALWWDPIQQLIKLQVLRGIPTSAQIFDEGNTLEGSLTIKDQPNTRLSQVFTYYGQRNPLLPIDEENNFLSAALTVDGDAELDYGTPAIKKIYSRWIPFGARTVALRLNDLQLGRFRDPPRRFSLSAFRYGA